MARKFCAGLVVQGAHRPLRGGPSLEKVRPLALDGGAGSFRLARLRGQLWMEVRIWNFYTFEDLPVNALLGSLFCGD